MIDGVPHVLHGQRLAEPGLDQVQHAGLEYGAIRRVHAHVRDLLADERLGSGLDGALGGERKGREQQHAHQNVCLFRTSSA